MWIQAIWCCRGLNTRRLNPFYKMGFTDYRHDFGGFYNDQSLKAPYETNRAMGWIQVNKYCRGLNDILY